MSQTIIELRNIHKNYGDLPVLRGVSLSAAAGDIIAIIGSSGSGKSTLLRCANLLELPQSGDIVFLGEAVRWSSGAGERRPQDAAQVRALRTKLTMVFQQFNLWAHMSILENVIEAPITVLKRNRAEMMELGQSLLDKVGIGDKSANYPSQLSGGQQQRAAIARALAMEPRALLFDEPTSALDPELQQEVVQVIRNLAAEGRTMILVTHDMKLAREVSQQVIFLHNGCIEEQGQPEQLFDNPQSPRLQQFLRAADGV